MHCAGFQNDSGFSDKAWAESVVAEGNALFDAIEAGDGK